MSYYQSASFWVGAVVILIYALERFNTPPTNRPSTTWLRYYSAAFVYVGLFELTFVILCHYPNLVTLLQALPGFEGLTTSAEGVSDSQFGTAILLSVLVPKVPGLQRIDLDIRHQLQRAAAIPTEARRFAREIQRSSYQPDATLATAVAAALRERGLDGAIELEPLLPLRRLVAMMLRLREWETDIRFAPFLHERDAQYDRLQARYQRVMEMTRGYLALPLANQPGASPEPAAQRFLQAFEEETQALLQEGSELASHSLLNCCLRAVTREQELQAMGLVVSSEPRLAIDVDQVTLLLGALIALFTLYVMLVFEPGARSVFTLLAKIPVIYTIAVICAVVPKQHWPLFQRRDDSHIPAFGYLLSGLMAAIAAVLVSVLIDSLLLWRALPASGEPLGLGGALASAWDDYWSRRYPWLLLPAAAAMATAAIIDCRWLQRWGEGWQRRVADALTMALVMGIAGWLVQQWLLLASSSMRQMPLLRVVLLVVLVGALIGALVPAWFRHSSHSPPANNKAPAGALQGG